jgi:hypothetical protein
MQEPLVAALAIGLVTIVALVGFAVHVTRRQRRAALDPDRVAGPLPILRISRAAGAAALMAHELDVDERVIFEAMDAAVQQLSQTGDAAHDFDANRDCVATVGAAYGLDRADSIAFWMRATFSRFEPAGGM